MRVNLNFKQFGNSGADLIILHGLFGMLDNWNTLAREFAKEYKVWILDLRNHGKSPHSDEFNYELMAEDIMGFMEQQNIQKANILGHSMGGKAAMQFAFSFPDKVEKLIVADIAPRAYSAKHDYIIEALLSSDPTTFENRQDAERKLFEKIPEMGTVQFLLKNLSREGEHYKWKMNLPVLADKYEIISSAITGKFNGPTLFIKGSKSAYITQEDEKDIKAQFPQAKFVSIQGSGHWLHADNPQKFAEVVTDFLHE